jgi:hypothetical protein
MKSEKRPPEQPYTPVADIVVVAVAMAVPDEVADMEVDEEMHTRSTYAHTAKWTIIPLKHAERQKALNMTMAIQTPRGMTSDHAITAVSQDTSRATASTSNVPGIKRTKSTKAQHPHRLLQLEIAT